MATATGEVIQVPPEPTTVHVLVRVTKDTAKLLKAGDILTFEVKP